MALVMVCSTLCWADCHTLDLSVVIAKDFMVIGARGGFSPNIFYTTLSDRYGKRYVTLHRESADDPGRIMWALYSEKNGVLDSVIVDKNHKMYNAVGLGEGGIMPPPDSAENNIEGQGQHYVRITADYKQAILGKWEGHVTSEQGSEFDDGEDHQWEYLADGTFRYYSQDGNGTWVTNPNQTLSQYFVDGTLLCTRWVIDGTENREWWEIESIADGVMNWTALRQREDGTTYTATFQMTKVN